MNAGTWNLERRTLELEPGTWNAGWNVEHWNLKPGMLHTGWNTGRNAGWDAGWTVEDWNLEPGTLNLERRTLELEPGPWGAG